MVRSSQWEGRPLGSSPNAAAQTNRILKSFASEAAKLSGPPGWGILVAKSSARLFQPLFSPRVPPGPRTACCCASPARLATSVGRGAEERAGEALAAARDSAREGAHATKDAAAGADQWRSGLEPLGAKRIARQRLVSLEGSTMGKEKKNDEEGMARQFTSDSSRPPGDALGVGDPWVRRGTQLTPGRKRSL